MNVLEYSLYLDRLEYLVLNENDDLLTLINNWTVESPTFYDDKAASYFNSKD